VKISRGIRKLCFGYLNLKSYTLSKSVGKGYRYRVDVEFDGNRSRNKEVVLRTYLNLQSGTFTKSVGKGWG